MKRRTFAILALSAMLLWCGCSSQPMTLDQELATAGVGAVVGAAGGALVGSQTRYSLPLSIFIGAAGVAVAILLYEEIKREATSSNFPTDNSNANPSPSNSQ